jgi:hypothetical protein
MSRKVVRINDRGEITLAPLVDFRDPRTRLPQVGRGANAAGFPAGANAAGLPTGQAVRIRPPVPPAFLMRGLQSASSSG